MRGTSKTKTKTNKPQTTCKQWQRDNNCPALAQLSFSKIDSNNPRYTIIKIFHLLVEVYHGQWLQHWKVAVAVTVMGCYFHKKRGAGAQDTHIFES